MGSRTTPLLYRANNRVTIEVHEPSTMPQYASDLIWRHIEVFPVGLHINPMEKNHGILHWSPDIP